MKIQDLLNKKVMLLDLQATTKEAAIDEMINSLVDNGVVVIRPVDGDKLVAAVQGGFLSVSEDKVTILAEFAVWADEIDVAEAEVAAASDDEETKALGEAKLRAVRRNQES